VCLPQRNGIRRRRWRLWLAYPIMASFRYVPYVVCVACVALAGNPALVELLVRGVARNLIWVGINGPRRQNNHIKKIKVDWFGGIYTDIPPSLRPCYLSCLKGTYRPGCWSFRFNNNYYFISFWQTETVIIRCVYRYTAVQSTVPETCLFLSCPW